MAHTSTKKNECGLPPGASMYYSPPPLISLVVLKDLLEESLKIILEVRCQTGESWTTVTKVIR